MMKTLAVSILVGCMAITSSVNAANVLFLAGKHSHAKGQHDFHAGCDLLSETLKKSGFQTKVIYDKWPEASAFKGVDAVVIYCDGAKYHIILGHEKELQALSDSGIGIMCMHYAVEGNPGILNDTLLNVIGGYYLRGKSKNPTWTIKDMQIAKHPTGNGVKPFSMLDEWYYNLVFENAVPIMTGTPPRAKGKRHTLAWVYTSPKGTRGAGFTGGHYHKNWYNTNNSKLILNMIAWVAGAKIPADGIESVPTIPLDNETILEAAALGDSADLKKHIELGGDANTCDRQGWRPIHHAAAHNEIECAEILLKNGARVDFCTKSQRSALHYAAYRNFAPMVSLLLKNGASVDRCDNYGRTALHYAAKKNGAECVKLLLESGAKKDIKDYDGKTALDYAVEQENKKVAALLK